MGNKRKAGILLHITSLNGKYGIGTIGKEAYEFVDFLKKSKMKLWQILPLTPTSYGDSPYQSVSSDALNYYMIDLDGLVKEGLIFNDDIINMNFKNSEKVDFSEMFEKKTKILKKAFSNFNINNEEFKKFFSFKKYTDFALFMTIKEKHNYASWKDWEPKYQNYSLYIENEIIRDYKDTYNFWLFTQYIFVIQWKKLKKYANKKGIEIIGDIPLYIGYDSVEVWKYPNLFKLDAKKNMLSMAGCPPDGFSEDGQLWGNPIYDWESMKKDNYTWWKNRIYHTFEFVDILRIDHFRGFDRYWSVPANDKTAKNGSWIDGPKIELFKDILDLKIIAEDLGLIDEGVHQLMKDTNYPGMKILEFAFDGNKEHEHKPRNYTNNFVVYTGTHDNEPLYQYIKDLNEESIEIFKKDLKEELLYFNIDTKMETYCDMVYKVIELGYASIADIVIIPMQDLLCQDGRFRMNLPSTVSTNNWSYRIKKSDLSNELIKKLKGFIKKYER